jgi:hypothetical protein
MANSKATVRMIFAEEMPNEVPRVLGFIGSSRVTQPEGCGYNSYTLEDNLLSQPYLRFDVKPSSASDGAGWAIGTALEIL